jgi:hypothetical protein
VSPLRGSMPFTEHRKHLRGRAHRRHRDCTLTQPGKLNALTFEAHADLRDLVAEVPQRAEARLMPGTDRTGAPPYE